MEYETGMEVRELLDFKAAHYNRPDFIAHDPISIPHRFTRSEDIEISGFFASVLAWGTRKTIIGNTMKLMELMDQAPSDFIKGFSPRELERFSGFVHRTFNGTDCTSFIRSLQKIYLHHGGMEQLFTELFRSSPDPGTPIHRFRDAFFKTPHQRRSEKHLGDPLRGSACKRICMFLRWMVRNDGCGVDFGLWKQIDPAKLAIPLDTHSARTARALGLLSRRSNDWKAVLELTRSLKKFDPHDPVKYDFALFGMGAFEGFPAEDT